MIKNKAIYVTWYHATDYTSAQTIFAGGINISQGGGELGQGFYMGNRLDEAKSWAFHKNKKIHIPDSIIEFKFEPWITFKYQHIGLKRAKLEYAKMNTSGTARTYVFGFDFVYSKVFGIEKYGFYQLKWESILGETFLNKLPGMHSKKII